jgi:hypothetical protein
MYFYTRLRTANRVLCGRASQGGDVKKVTIFRHLIGLYAMRLASY